MVAETLILVAISLLFVANFWAKRREMEQDKTDSAYRIRIDQRMDRIDRILACWAENWGEPAEDVKAKLREILKVDVK